MREGRASLPGGLVSEQPDQVDAAEEEKPRGAYFLGLVFIVMIVVLWFWTYAVLLDRV